MTENDDAQPAAPGKRDEAAAGFDRQPPRQNGDAHASSSSQRTRLVPPDGKPLHWTSRYRKHIHAVEWLATGLFFLLACYYVYLLVFPASPSRPTAGPPPSQEAFRAQLRALPPIDARPEWIVDSQIGRWRSIVLHHSATESGNPESFDKYHREVNKWENGLGYHFVIGNGNGMADGEVAVGHRWRDQLDGAHVRGKESEGNANSFSIGICLVGNFNNSLPTARQLASLKGLLAFLRREYGIGLAAIVGHNAAAVGNTDCPGKFFFVEEVALALANP